jgi:RNA polymerase sigma-70 factor (ECF subfamily)
MNALGERESDEDLAAAAAAGDASAFEKLVERYQVRAYGLVHRLVGAGGDPQDALQEAFLQVFRKLPSFRGEAKFSTWLYRVVTNAALMQLRQRTRRPTEPLDAYLPRFDATGRHAAGPEELESPAHAEEQLDRSFLARKAIEGLERLPEPYRVAFVLRDLEEMPTVEVADVLGLEPAAVRQRVHRARLMLRGYLSDLVRVKP